MKDITKRLSKSKLNTFKECPKKYYFTQYFPEEFIESEAMKRGSQLHQLLEDYYKKYNGKNIRTKESALKEFSKIEGNEEHFEEIKKFIDWLDKRGFPIPESLEEKIYSKKQDIVIMWDRIDFDGKVRILWDYKTGKLYKGKQFIDKFKFELMFYAFIYMLETKKKIDYVGIYFIDHGIQTLIKVTNEEIQKIINEIFELKLEMKDYQKNNIWPGRYSWKCRWCNYKDRCEEYKQYNK